MDNARRQALKQVDPFFILLQVVSAIYRLLNDEQREKIIVEVGMTDTIVFGPKTLLFGFDCHKELESVACILLTSPKPHAESHAELLENDDPAPDHPDSDPAAFRDVYQNYKWLKMLPNIQQ